MQFNVVLGGIERPIFCFDRLIDSNAQICMKTKKAPDRDSLERDQGPLYTNVPVLLNYWKTIEYSQ